MFFSKYTIYSVLAALCLFSLNNDVFADVPVPDGRWKAFEGGKNATPPMGWASWNAFHLDISQGKIYGIADAMVSKGFKAVGYKYVNIDDGWWKKRRTTGKSMQIKTNLFPAAATTVYTNARQDNIINNPFPNNAAVTAFLSSYGYGPKPSSTFLPLTTYIHNKGLKAGIYSDIGRNSCGQYWDSEDHNQPQGTQIEREVGLYGHIIKDINLYFKTWGFDYLKLDACGISDFTSSTDLVTDGRYRSLGPFLARGWYTDNHVATTSGLFADVRDALMAANPDNDFVLSITTWGEGNVQHWGAETGNSWRTTSDISSNWNSMISKYDTTVSKTLYAGPHHWNDPDMMFVGVNEFDGSTTKKLNNARTHFGLWSMLNAPLLMGADIRQSIPENIQNILKNTEVIALNQDVGGHQATKVFDDGNKEILVKTLSTGPGVKAVAFLNRGNSSANMTVNWAQLKLKPGTSAGVRNLWSKSGLTDHTDSFSTNVGAHDTKLFLFSGTHKLTNGRYLSELPGIIHISKNGYSEALADKSIDGNTLTLKGTTYNYGIGVHADSLIQVKLNGNYKKFSATVGVDDEVGSGGSIIFKVYGDGALLHETSSLRKGDQPVDISVSVANTNILELVANGGENISRDHADWANAILTTSAITTDPQAPITTAPQVIIYEAEGGSTTGRAASAYCYTCSGTTKVGYIGNGAANQLTISNINVSTAGTYRLIVHYLTGEDRSLGISVNEGVEAVYNNLNSGGWFNIKTATSTIRLNAGNNAIRMFNKSAWAPDIDKIEIVSQ